MAEADKRGQLSSRLLVPKNTDVPMSRRGAALTLAREADVEPPEATPGEEGADLLYTKGDASASTFRPSYWSYDRKSGNDATGGATVTPISPTVVGKLSVEPARAPRAVALPRQRRRWYRRTVNIVLLSVSVAALAAAAGFFLLWPEPHAPQVATAPAPPVVVSLSPPAVAPASSEPPASPPADVAPMTAGPSESPAPTPVSPAAAEPSTAVAPAAPTEPAPATPVAPAAAAPAPAPPADGAIASTANAEQDVKPLLARGDELRATGDFASARLFYERAAELGSAAGARAAGETYDPGVLEEAHARGVRGDTALAAHWYQRAIDGGDAPARVRLQNLMAKKTAN